MGDIPDELVLTREEAEKFVADEFYPPEGADAHIRIVKLVRPVKP